MEEAKKKLFSILLKLGLPMGSFTITQQQNDGFEVLSVKAFKILIPSERLPVAVDGIPVIYNTTANS
jgi:hypothetical protein